MPEPHNSEIIVEIVSTKSGHNLGLLTLNRPKSLNALTAKMCQYLHQQLKQWQDDSSIVAVVIKSSHDKAFCAGGDIRKLCDANLDKKVDDGQPNHYSQDFFESEYRLLRYLHYYQKPTILWANGIVMGGGMGLMAMCSHRVVTEQTTFSMPEIGIGLYPDATGSWFLQRFPAKSGLFLGLTGAKGNGADALLANIAEYATDSDNYQGLLDALLSANWHADMDLADSASQALASIHHTHHLPKSHIESHWQVIQSIVNQGHITHIDKKLRTTDFDEALNSPWLKNAVNNYKTGCAVSASLTYEIFQRALTLSLEQILYLELNVSLHCTNNFDFQEGVRALLIDKDKNPMWSRDLSECYNEQGKAYIDAHFQSPYPKDSHPFHRWIDKTTPFLGDK